MVTVHFAEWMIGCFAKGIHLKDASLKGFTKGMFQRNVILFMYKLLPYSFACYFIIIKHNK